MRGSILVAVAVLVICGVLLAGWPRRHGGVPESATADEYTAAVARHLHQTRWVAWPLGLALAAASIGTFDQQAVIVAPVLLMLGVVLAFAVGELTAPVPARTRARSASLEPRIPLSYLNPARRSLWIAALFTALATAALAVFLADDTGAGVSLSCAAGSQSAGPFPGLAYGAGGLWALVPVELVAALAFQRVISRPASSVPEAAPADRLLRVTTTYAVVRAATAACLLVVAGVGFPAGLGLVQLRVGVCPAGWRVPLGWTLVVLSIVAAIGLLGVAVDAVRAGRAGGVRAVARQHG
jgi:hypothetical protein